jgi:hypothetical protein
MSPRRLYTLCELEWLTFGVNWPPQGILDLPTVKAIYQIIIGTPRHPDQFPYIGSWLQVAQTMPPLGVILCQQKGTEQSFHGSSNEA